MFSTSRDGKLLRINPPVDDGEPMSYGMIGLPIIYCLWKILSGDVRCVVGKYPSRSRETNNGCEARPGRGSFDRFQHYRRTEGENCSMLVISRARDHRKRTRVLCLEPKRRPSSDANNDVTITLRVPYVIYYKTDFHGSPMVLHVTGHQNPVLAAYSVFVNTDNNLNKNNETREVNILIWSASKNSRCCGPVTCVSKKWNFKLRFENNNSLHQSSRPALPCTAFCTKFKSWPWRELFSHNCLFSNGRDLRLHTLLSTRVPRV